MDEKIDLNTADVGTLTQLPGIGEKLAARIIEYRSTVHPFEEVIELAAVPGISERMVREISDSLSVGDGAPDTGSAPAQAETEAEAAEEVDAEAETETEAGTQTVADVGGQTAVEAEAAEARAESAGPQAAIAGDRDETAAQEAERPTVDVALRPSPLWGHLLSALAGALLTLLALWLINGTLQFAEAERTADLQRQMDEERDRRTAQGRDVQALSEGMATAEAQRQAVAGDVERLEGALESSVETLEAETAALSEEVESVVVAAETFNEFLDGMRDLLVRLQGPPSTATPTATPSVTATPTETPQTTPTDPSISATRTPRPTATPLMGVTPTAADNS